MSNTFKGNATNVAGRFAIVVARFNESITSRLLDGAVTTLLDHGVTDDRIDVAWVPGAFEIPTVAGRLVRSGRYAAVLCLGAVVRGETSHDQHINRAVSTALAELGATSGVPVLFGILTCNTLDQAVARSGGSPTGPDKSTSGHRAGNKRDRLRPSRAGDGRSFGEAPAIICRGRPPWRPGVFNGKMISHSGASHGSLHPTKPGLAPNG